MVSFAPGEQAACHFRAVSEEKEATRVKVGRTNVVRYERFLSEASEIALSGLSITGTKVVIPLPSPHLDGQNANIPHPIPHFVQEGSPGLQAFADRQAPDFSHDRGRLGYKWMVPHQISMPAAAGVLTKGAHSDGLQLAAEWSLLSVGKPTASLPTA